MSVLTSVAPLEVEAADVGDTEMIALAAAASGFIALVIGALIALCRYCRNRASDKGRQANERREIVHTATKERRERKKSDKKAAKERRDQRRQQLKMSKNEDQGPHGAKAGGKPEKDILESTGLFSISMLSDADISDLSSDNSDSSEELPDIVLPTVNLESALLSKNENDNIDGDRPVLPPSSSRNRRRLK